MTSPRKGDPDATDRASAGENRAPFGAGAEVLCHTIPELGAMPLPEKGGQRRVVRLVSMNKETDLSIELQLGVNKVGRQRNGNHIVLVSGEISRFHAEVEVRDDEIVIRDLGSSNGTFVNGQRVEKEHPLYAGDSVGFSTQFAFQLLIDMITQPPEVMTIGGPHMPEVAPTPAPAEEIDPAPVPSSLEDRRRELEQGSRRRITADRLGLTRPSAPGVSPPPPPAQLPPMPALPRAGRTEPPALPRVQPARLAVPLATTGPNLPPVSTAPFGASSGATPSAAAPIAPTPSEIGAELVAEDDDEVVPSMASAASAADRDTAAEAPELAVLERERRQLAVLYQVSKRCMSAETLAELDRLLINVLERIVAFDRGFITYQLPSGDWKLVMSPKGDRWDRTIVRSLLQQALRLKVPLAIPRSAADDRLGTAGHGKTDSRLLLPLRSRAAPVGAIFLVSSRSESFDDQTVDFLALFADIAALAVVNCARLEAGSA